MIKAPTIQDEMHRLMSDIKDIKFRQTIGGDSWVVYRTEREVTLTEDHSYVINFRPNSTGNFIAQASMYSFDISGNKVNIGADLFPDPDTQGKWWMPPVASTSQQIIFIFSTKKGSIEIEDVTPA